MDGMERLLTLSLRRFGALGWAVVRRFADGGFAH
jgi:hypothetical protein